MAVSYGTYTITEVQEGSQIWTTIVAPVSPDYTFAISNLTGDSDASVKIGDIIMYSYYRYTILSISSDGTTVLTGNRVSIRGATGADSVTYTLIVSNLAIIKDKNGNISPTTITLTAKSQTGSSAMANYAGRFKIETTINNSTWTTQYISSANEATKNWTVIDDIIAVRCSLYLKDGTTTLLDQQTIPIVSDGIDGTDGNDAYSIILTNENHTFAGNTISALESEIECNVIAYKGATQVASTIGTITGQPTGMTTSLLNNGTVNSAFKVTVTTSMVTRNGVLSIPITVDGKTFTKEFTYALTLDGEDGDKGDTAQWYYGELLTHTNGTATLPISQTEGAVVGAMYLNTKTGTCYKCTTVSGTNATWTYAGNITDGIEIGGRNLLKGSDVAHTSLSGTVVGGTTTQVIPSGTVITLSAQIDADDVVWESSGHRRMGVASSIPKDGGGTQYIEAWAAMTGYTSTGIDKYFDTSFHGRVKSTYTLQGELPLDKAFYLYIQGVTSGTVSVSRPKLEIGNKSTDWTPAPEDIIVGKNLIPLSKNLKSFTPENLTRSTVTYTDDSCTITNTYGDVRYGVYYDIDVESGSTYTLSFQASNVSGTNINYGVGNRTPDQTASWNTITGGYKDVVNGSNVCTFTIPDTVTKVRVYFGAGSLNGTMTISDLKLEVGNRATEWTSAPEDIQYAMKVATNYLSIDDTGIMVANMKDGEQKPREATGRNVFIDNDSVDIRNGTTTLASFTGDNTKFYDPIYKKELATFGTGGAIIGAENEQRFIIEKDSVRAINSSGGTLFSIVSTNKTFETKAEVAPAGEVDAITSGSTITLDVGDSVSEKTFYIKNIRVIIAIQGSSSVLNNVKVNSVNADATRFYYYNGSDDYPYNYSQHSIIIPESPAFSCNYGASKTVTYEITANFTNDYNDSYNLTCNFTLTYNGERTLNLSILEGFCTRTSENNGGEASFDTFFDEFSSKYTYTPVISSTAHTKAPAMTFGTRTGEDGMLSSAFGQGLYAEKEGEFVIGRYNNQELQTDSKYSFVIGNGLTKEHRSNALTIDWSGNICLGVDVAGSETDAELVIAITNAGWDDDVYDD